MDICGYIDQQYNILNRSLLETEIEYQHECFKSLKKKYNAYITEETNEDEFEDDDEYNPSRVKEILSKIAFAIRKFIKKITDAMQIWIVKILNHSKILGTALTKVFNENKFTAPSFSIKFSAYSVIDVLDAYDDEIDWYEAIRHLNNFIQFVHDKMEERTLVTYETTIKELLAYKDSIKTIKKYEKVIINSNKFRGKDYVKDVKWDLRLIKSVIKAIHQKAVYCAKLILKAAKIANKQNTTIPQWEIDKMNDDIYEFNFNELVLKAGASENFFDDDTFEEDD